MAVRTFSAVVVRRASPSVPTTTAALQAMEALLAAVEGRVPWSVARSLVADSLLALPQSRRGPSTGVSDNSHQLVEGAGAAASAGAGAAAAGSGAAASAGGGAAAAGSSLAPHHLIAASPTRLVRAPKRRCVCVPSNVLPARHWSCSAVCAVTRSPRVAGWALVHRRPGLSQGGRRRPSPCAASADKLGTRVGRRRARWGARSVAGGSCWWWTMLLLRSTSCHRRCAWLACEGGMLCVGQPCVCSRCVCSRCGGHLGWPGRAPWLPWVGTLAGLGGHLGWPGWAPWLGC